MNTVAILGCGTRGMIYARELDKYHSITVTAVCDTVYDKAKKAAAVSGGAARIFTDEQAFFSAGKLADVLIVATQDNAHYGHAMQALALNYHLLLEKPVSGVESECEDVAKAAQEKQRLVLVCHVLRYTSFYKTIAEIVRQGRLGDIVHISQTEHVGYWHFAHSYVRGPWRNAQNSCPLLLAKCCHDLDLLQWYINSTCREVSSFGDRTVFKKSAMPEDCGSYCLQNCPPHCKQTCPYDAEKIYLAQRENGTAPVLSDAGLQVVGKPDASEAEMRNALKNGPYGRCVYRSDNNVCDHQTVNMKWESGATSTLTVTAFTRDCYRSIEITGTKGDLVGNDQNNCLTLHTFLDDKEEHIPLAHYTEKGHLGGDAGLVQTLVQLMQGETVDSDYLTTIDCTLQSHRIGFAAEQSRQSGKIITL